MAEIEKMSQSGNAQHRRWMLWSILGTLVLFPALAMLVSDEVQWNLMDFLAAGSLLFIFGLAFELLAGNAGNRTYQIATGLTLTAGLSLIWVNAAVGIIGSENNDANFMYGFVLAVALIGVFASRFKAAGMSRTMFLTVLTQILVAAIAILAGLGSNAPIWPRDILGLTAGFVLFWLISAGLFQKTEREDGHGRNGNLTAQEG